MPLPSSGSFTNPSIGRHSDEEDTEDVVVGVFVVVVAVVVVIAMKPSPLRS